MPQVEFQYIDKETAKLCNECLELLGEDLKQNGGVFIQELNQGAVNN